MIPTIHNFRKLKLINSDRNLISDGLGMEYGERQDGEITKVHEDTLWGDEYTHYWIVVMVS